MKALDRANRIIRALVHPKTADDLARELGMHQPNICRDLNDLRSLGWVEPDGFARLGGKGKGRSPRLWRRCIRFVEYPT